MRTVARHVTEIRPYFASPDADLLKVVLNSTSWAEANLALDLLAETVPAKALVTAANLREAIRDLPRCPISMAVDFKTLARVWELDREEMGYVRSFEDSAGTYDLVLLGQGNLCYDIVVRSGGRTLMWMPVAPEDDLLDPEVVDLVMRHDSLLKNVVDLVQAMGLAFYPVFYLSLDDWHEQHAEDIFAEIEHEFGDDEVEAPAESEETDSWYEIPGTQIRYRGWSRDDGIQWIM